MTISGKRAAEVPRLRWGKTFGSALKGEAGFASSNRMIQFWLRKFHLFGKMHLLGRIYLFGKAREDVTLLGIHLFLNKIALMEARDGIMGGIST